VIRVIVPFALSNLLSGLVSLLSILLFSRLLSADAYGKYVTVLASVTLCQTAGFNWLQSSITRLYPEEADQSGRDRLAQAVKLGCRLSTIVSSSVWLIGLFALAQSGSLGIGAAGLSALLSGAWAATGQSWARVLQRPWRFAAAQAVQTVGGLLLALAGLKWCPGDPLVILGAMTLASISASFITPVRTAGASAGLRETLSRLCRMWKFGGPVTGLSICYVILATSDRLLISGLLGAAAAGAYTIAAGIAARALALLLAPIVIATKPQVFIEFRRQGAPAASELLRRMSGWLTAVGLPTTILLVSARHMLTSVLIGREFADVASALLPWTAIGALLSSFLTLHFALGYQIAHRTRYLLVTVGLIAALNVLLNWMLLPRFGILAAGWSIVGCYSLALILTIRLGREHFCVPFSVSDALRSALACVPLAAFLRLDFQRSVSSLLLMLGGAALIYAISALTLNVAGSRAYFVRWLLRPSAVQPLV
jgi:O-antigen/teichoic acid export membrane protein